MGELTQKEFWDKEWKSEYRNNYEEFVFAELIYKYLPSEGKYFEIGCAPGSIMVYFNKCLNYTVSGIDFSSIKTIEDYLIKHNVEQYKLYEEDFTKFVTNEKFDIVSSFGFVEHFSNYNEIIAKHIELVNDGGYLIIEVPNIRYFNWLLFRISQPELLKLHNLKVMDLYELSEEVSSHNNFEILYCNYFKSCFLFFNENNSHLNPIFKKVFGVLKKILKIIKLDNISNKFFSPYIVLIAKKIR